MTFSEITEFINTQHEHAIIEANEDGLDPFILIDAFYLIEVCKTLHTSDGYYFDFLNCITAVDLHPEEEFELIYHLSSLAYNHKYILKVRLDRNDPKIDSLESIWKTADWHEREAFDFFGIQFNNHPNLSRILLPTNWEGHPLRKDYQEQEKYHGITVKY